MSLIPPELLSLVNDFKSFVKNQKAIREENCSQRFSTAPIVAIEKELEESVSPALHKIELDLQQKNKLVESLKNNTTTLLKDADLAHRLLKTEIGYTATSFIGSSNENPLVNPSAKNYFLRLVEQFENQMSNYSKRIKDLEQQLNNLNKPCTPEELILTMKKQHEALIALAAEVYMVHEEIAKLKKQQDKNGTEEIEAKLKGLTSF